MKKVVGYVRVSTQEQADEGYSISEQQDRLKKYCDAQGWTLVHVYTDPGFSGAKLDRPALQQLLSDIPSGAFDTVLVFKLDRLSRSQKDTMYLLEDQFIKNNIDFCSVMESSLNTSTPLGKAMIGILSVFAQLERNNITERMTMGRIGRAKSGKHSGGVAPFGYDYIDGELVINESEAVQVRLIFNLFLYGLNGKEMSLKGILTYLHDRYNIRGAEWLYASTIPRIIQNPVYCGMIKFSGKPYPGTHEPIIPKEEWDKAQAKYENYITSFTDSISNFKHAKYLLTGLMKCGLCGGNYGTHTWKNRHVTSSTLPLYGYYECRQRYSKVNKINCGNAHYNIRNLDNQIICEIRSLSLDPEELKAVASDKKNSNEAPAYTAAIKHLAEIDKQVSKLIDLYQVEGIDIAMVSARIKTLNEDRDRTNVIIAEYEKSKPQPTSSVEEAIKMLRTFDEVLISGDVELIRTAIRSLIDSIVIYPDQIEIHWSFT